MKLEVRILLYLLGFICGVEKWYSLYCFVFI